MGTYEGQWGPMGAFGDLWGPMGTFSELWFFLAFSCWLDLPNPFISLFFSFVGFCTPILTPTAPLAPPPLPPSIRPSHIMRRPLGYTAHTTCYIRHETSDLTHNRAADVTLVQRRPEFRYRSFFKTKLSCRHGCAKTFGRIK